MSKRTVISIMTAMMTAAALTLSACSGQEAALSEAAAETETAAYTDLPERVKMPAPFEYSDGDNALVFYSTVDLKLGSIDMSFVELAGYEEFEEWIGRTSSSRSDLTSVGEAANLYSFIKYFNIPDETVRQAFAAIKTGEEEVDMSEEEIDLILSGDDEAVAEHFAASTAIVRGSDIYSLKWIYYHQASDYIEKGITPEELEALLPAFERSGLRTAAMDAVRKKIEAYSEWASRT